MFATNVTGLINMTQAVLPTFLARPEGGRGDIINIGSIAGREPYPGGAIYCATKAAVRSFTESLRKELIASRVRVLEVDPGQVETVCFFSFTISSSLVLWLRQNVSYRNSRLYGFTATRRRQMPFMRKYLTLLLEMITLAATNALFHTVVVSH